MQKNHHLEHQLSSSPPSFSFPTKHTTLFNKVQATAVEAIHGKNSCIAKRYYHDRFLQSFRPSHPPRPIMSPLINRGYYTRVRALEHVIQAFMKAVHQCKKWSHANLLVLGAGLDTLCFRMMDESNKNGGGSDVRLQFYEVDYATVVRHKSACIRRSNELVPLLGLPSQEATAAAREGGAGGADASPSSPPISARKECGPVLCSNPPGYVLVAADLADPVGLEGALEEAGLDSTLPTLVIAECVLVYMEPEDSMKLIQWTSQKFQEGALVSYDMILPDDSFGRVMRSNLKARGLELPGFERWRDLHAQLERFVGEGGWDCAVAGDMNAVYAELLHPADREKAQKLEHLDEVEEWRMLMGHYCYVVARQGACLRGFLRGLEGFEERSSTEEEHQSDS